MPEAKCIRMIRGLVNSAREYWGKVEGAGAKPAEGRAASRMPDDKPPATTSETSQWSDADRAVRRSIFVEHEKLAWSNIQKSHESYDQSLLTFASGGLGLSLAFIKDVVPLDQATVLVLLYASWALFTTCILVTIGSFRLAIEVQKEHIERCDEYYQKGNEEIIKTPGKYQARLDKFTFWSGLTFFLALICTILFAGINVHREANMPKKHDAKIDTSSMTTDGQGSVPVTPVPKPSGSEDRGQGTVPIGKVPKTGGEQEKSTANTDDTKGGK